MTRVAVWGNWAKLCCTPRLWEALSAVSTESWLANSKAQRTAQAGSRLYLALWPFGPLLCPCSVLVAGSGPTNACHFVPARWFRHRRTNPFLGVGVPDRRVKGY